MLWKNPYGKYGLDSPLSLKGGTVIVDAEKIVIVGRTGKFILSVRIIKIQMINNRI